MTPLETEIAAVIDRLCACWGELALDRIAGLWDPEETEPYALPQEMAQPLIGWPALRAYLERAAARLHGASMRYWDLHAKQVAPDLAVTLYQMHWNGHVRGFALPMGVDTRVTAVLRRRRGAWLLCHYVEAPPAPLLHLQQCYAAAVDPDFRSPDAASPPEDAR